MIRQPTVPSDDLPPNDRSMRVAEYVLALLAIMVAAMLAVFR